MLKTQLFLNYRFLAILYKSWLFIAIAQMFNIEFKRVHRPIPFRFYQRLIWHKDIAEWP